MNRLITFFSFFTLASFVLALEFHPDHQDERMPPNRNYQEITLGLLAQHMDVGAVADVYEKGLLGNLMDTNSLAPFFMSNRREYKPPDLSKNIYLKVRVVKAIYGCTNGQELVVMTFDPETFDASPLYPEISHYDPLFEYTPSNHSRIVFAALRTDLEAKEWTPATWEKPPQPEVIVTNTAAIPCVLPAFTRSWWYDGYQNNLPYAQLTNLVHAARIERNWTNFYYICRDAVPTPASRRVWVDAYEDLGKLSFDIRQAYYDFMLNDPLYPAECREMLEEHADYIRPDDEKHEDEEED